MKIKLVIFFERVLEHKFKSNRKRKKMKLCKMKAIFNKNKIKIIISINKEKRI